MKELKIGMLEKKNVKKAIDIAVFLLLLGIFSYYMYRLVYSQALYAGRDDGYPSDIIAYIMEIEGTNTQYNFAYPLFFFVGKFFNLFMPINSAVAVAVVLFNALAVIFSKCIFERILFKENETKDSLIYHIVVSLAVIGCFFMSMWWVPRFGKFQLFHKIQVYEGVFSGNPWHNATYLATRPFSILCFFYFADLLKTYEKKIDIKAAVGFSICLLVATLAKPTFTLVLVSTAAVVMAVRLIRSKFGNFGNSVKLGLCFAPTFILLLVQFVDMFVSKTPDDVQGIRFAWFEVWKQQTPYVAEAVFYANVFSLVCLVFFVKDIKADVMYRFSVLLFLVSFLEAGLLCERGERFSHFNFSWGYMHGIFFFEMATLVKLLEVTFNRKRKPIPLVIMWLAFLSQVVAGVLYFKGVYSGLDYRTLLPATWLN